MASSRPLATSGEGPYGPLRAPDEHGIMLPEGFSARVVARSFEFVPGTLFPWHAYPDGGATFETPDGYVYVSNSEAPLIGGASAIRFDHDGRIRSAYRICTGTQVNCAGGKTPWGTWVTCEEWDWGYAWECDPLKPDSQVRRPALGRFTHEAVAVDPATSRVYLTEDKKDGCLYRFTPFRAGDLSSGYLEAAEVVDGKVRWHWVWRPDPLFPLVNPTRNQVSVATRFKGGEGIVYSAGYVFFTTKGDNRVWSLDVATDEIGLVYDASLDPGRQLTGVDNIAASTSGSDLLVAEDGGNMELVLLTSEGVAAPLLRVIGQDQSELTGPAFDPTGRRLYFSSQRGGPSGFGITYEVVGPFRRG